jgi:hypothetical protein
MSSLTVVLLALAAWLLFLAVLTGVLVVKTRNRRRDRRQSGDRRVGLPDLRPVKVERRRGTDRRGVAA